MSDISLYKFPVNIEDEMKRSYMDYAMSVIIGRALPDVRDGLKPAHRRVLYAMRQMGLASTRPYRKCAKIVGEVIGNFHPHGDQPAYDTLVRLAQDFNMRYLLVDGQGNFGSVDGDPPAAYRYTEARLEKLAEEMMGDLDKETVDFVPNFDETTEEPTVLPTTYPNLLVNGSTGIAVGMATNIPPHNMREVIDGVLALIELKTKRTESAEPTQAAGPSREARVRAVLKAIPGPDFPTGGSIIGRQGIFNAYMTGRGAITVRAKATTEESKKGDKVAIIVTEIPYQVNKKRLLENIAELVREKSIEGISDLRDESDRDGMRIVIELKRGEQPEVVLNNLYKHTQLQTTFGIIMLAIVGGRPRVLPIVDILEHFIEFRREVVRRRTEFELRRAEARAHILEGLRIALDNLDRVITLIRGSKNPGEAREGLMTQFQLSQLQSQAILDMQLQRLTGLERQKILDELAELLKTIERLRAILSSEALLMEVVMGELVAIRDKFSDERRTDLHRRQRRVPDRGPDRRRGDGDHGDEHRLRQAHRHLHLPRPAARRQGADRHAHARRGLRQPSLRRHHAQLPDDLLGPRPRLLAQGPRDSGRRTGRQGQGDRQPGLDGRRREDRGAARPSRTSPRTKGSSSPSWARARASSRRPTSRRSAIRARAASSRWAWKKVMRSSPSSCRAAAIRSSSAPATAWPFASRRATSRPMGRTAYGVRGITLREGDEVVGMDVVREGGTVLTVAQNGYGKRTDLEEYRLQSRGGVGIINIQTSDRNGKVVGMAYVHDDDEVMLMTQQGMILRMKAGDVRVIGRATQGVRLIEMEEGDQVVAIAKLAEKEVDSGNGGAGEPDPGTTEPGTPAEPETPTS